MYWVQNTPEILNIYENEFNKLSDRYFAEFPWPDAERISPLVDKGPFCVHSTVPFLFTTPAAVYYCVLLLYNSVYYCILLLYNSVYYCILLLHNSVYYSILLCHSCRSHVPCSVQGTPVQTDLCQAQGIGMQGGGGGGGGGGGSQCGGGTGGRDMQCGGRTHGQWGWGAGTAWYGNPWTVGAGTVWWENPWTVGVGGRDSMVGEPMDSGGQGQCGGGNPGQWGWGAGTVWYGNPWTVGAGTVWWGESWTVGGRDSVVWEPMDSGGGQCGGGTHGQWGAGTMLWGNPWTVGVGSRDSVVGKPSGQWGWGAGTVWWGNPGKV